jgi:rod shape-determining protein MreC
MNLALRLSLTSTILIVLSSTPLAVVHEELGGVAGGIAHYAGFSLARWVSREAAFYKNLRTLEADNAGLASEVNRLRGEMARVQEIERENEHLRTQLGLELELSVEEQLVLAQVIGLSSEQGSPMAVLDKGELDGVNTGDLVILGSYFIGEVARAERNRSLAMLLGDSRLSVAALDQDSPNRSRGIVSGGFGARLQMGKILPEEQVGEGDLIVSSGLDGKVSRGLVLGRVTRIIFSVGEILKEAELQLLFDPAKLEEVFIKKQ